MPQLVNRPCARIDVGQLVGVTARIWSTEAWPGSGYHLTVFVGPEHSALGICAEALYASVTMTRYPRRDVAVPNTLGTLHAKWAELDALRLRKDEQSARRARAVKPRRASNQVATMAMNGRRVSAPQAESDEAKIATVSE